MEIETLAVHAGREPDPATGRCANRSSCRPRSSGTRTAVIRAAITTRAPTTRSAARWSGRSRHSRAARTPSRSPRVRRRRSRHSRSPARRPDRLLVGLLPRHGEAAPRTAPKWGLRRSRRHDRHRRGRARTGTPAAMLWVETPSNPLLRVSDIAALGGARALRGVMLACDNTFASPILQRPLDLGADLVMHSTTKYLGGHSDVLGGALVVRESGEVRDRLRDFQGTGGRRALAFRLLAVLAASRRCHCASGRRPRARPRSRRSWCGSPGGARLLSGARDTPRPCAGLTPDDEGFGAVVSFQCRATLRRRCASLPDEDLHSRDEPRRRREPDRASRVDEGSQTPTPQNLLRTSIGLEGGVGPDRRPRRGARRLSAAQPAGFSRDLDRQAGLLPDRACRPGSQLQVLVAVGFERFGREPGAPARTAVQHDFLVLRDLGQPRRDLVVGMFTAPGTYPRRILGRADVDHEQRQDPSSPAARAPAAA